MSRRVSKPTRTAAGAATVEQVPIDTTWYKRAIFYELLVRGFADGNGDGSGDVTGLTEHRAYLQWLGVDCVWLLPINRSPMRDGGYDISDYYSLQPEYGSV